MLTITIPSVRLYNDDTNEFSYTKEQTLQLEHSLVSISKWESEWCKPFLSKGDKTTEETLDYIRCMTINKNVDPNIYEYLTTENVDDITKYIDAPMTATIIKKDKEINREIITSEIIYYWMIALNIPPKCDQWHLSRLLTLINVCNIKNSPPKKMTKQEQMAKNKALNESRKKAMNTTG